MKKRKLKTNRLIMLVICIILLPAYIFSQDLGSSSDLFRKKGSTSKTKKTTPKKSTPKKKENASARKSNSRTKSPSNVRKTPKRSKTKVTKSNTSSHRTKPIKKKQSDSDDENAETATNELDKKTEETIINDLDIETIEPVLNNSKITETASNKRKPKDKIFNNDIVISIGEPKNDEFSEPYEQAIIEGNTARNLREYDKAENAYSRAKSINSRDYRAIYGLGNIFSDQQRWEEAEKAYRQATLIEPQNPAAHIAISFVLTQPVAGVNTESRFVEAEKMARRAIELDPLNAIGFDQLGVALELQGYTNTETQNAYQRAISLSPDFALAYAHLARLLRRKGLNKESSAAYRRAIQLSTDVPSMILVADVLQSQQRYLESEQLLRTALRLDPKNPTGLYLLGQTLTTRKKFDEAESVLNKSVEVSPNSFVSYILLSSLYYKSGRLLLAEQTLNKARQVISENEKKRLAQEFEEVGDRYLQINRNTDALRVYLRANELDSTRSSLSQKIEKAKLN